MKSVVEVNSMPSSNQIGIFDSGVGGLSVLQELRHCLPHEGFIYFADSAYCPYGGKPPELIRKRALVISKFLVDKGAKLIVVASNTTSASGLEALRDYLNIPVVGVEPAVKPAAALSNHGKVGVLATGVTLASSRFNSLVTRYCDGVEVLTQPCPGLVELIEQGNIEEARPLLTSYLVPLLEQGATTIVLGCTHYPFLRGLVKEIAGEGVLIIDSGEAVAKQTARVLQQKNLFSTAEIAGKVEYFTSGEAKQASRVMGILLGEPQVVAKSVRL